MKPHLGCAVNCLGTILVVLGPSTKFVWNVST